MSDGAAHGELVRRGTIARLIVPERPAMPGRTPRLDRRLRAALWVLLALFSLGGVFGRSLWGGNDTREGGMIWDMVRHGTYVTPTIDGRPFLEKPPLLHWTGIAVCRIAGRVTEGLVRLPAALYGFGTLALLVLLVRGPRAPGEPPMVDGRELAAWAAAFLCGTAIQFQEYARVVLTDMALVFMVTLSLSLFWRAFLAGGRGRWLAFLLAASAAFYAKGLIGPALVWAAVGTFLILKRRWRLLAGLAGSYLPLLVLAVLPWAIALHAFGGDAAVRFVFWDNQIGRFFTFSDANLPHDPFFINKEPWHYYLTTLPVYLAPWTLLLVPNLVAWVRRSSPFRAAFHEFVASVVIAMALVLQASSAKVANYALPLYPFLFAAVGIWLAELPGRRPTPLERWMTRATGAGVSLLLAFTAVAFIGGTFAYPELFRVGGLLRTGSGLLLATLLLVLALAAVFAVVRLARSPARELVVVAAPAAYAVLITLALQLVTPVIDRQRSYKPMADLAAAESARGANVGLATGAYRDVGAFTFYLDRRLPLLTAPGDVAAFLASPEARVVIAPEATLPSLEAALAEVPYGRLGAGGAGTLSRSYVLLANRADQELAGRGGASFGGEDVREARALGGAMRRAIGLRHPPAAPASRKGNEVR